MANEHVSVTKPLLPAALVKAQREVQSALKSSKNEFHKYRYASAEEVLTVGRDALNDNGLSLSPVFEVLIALPASMTGDENGGAACLLHGRYLLQHDSGESLEIDTHVPVCPERAKSGGWSRPLDKALFGARTEALSYVLRDLLLIPRVDAPDVSGRADRGDRVPRQEPARPNGRPVTAADSSQGVASLDDALETAVKEGLAAASAKDPAAYEKAKAKLTAWCMAHNKSKADHDAAQAKMKERVAAGAKPAKPETDEERARRIDAGQA